MKCLVTGGAGFLGLHLAERLASLGHEVVVFDLASSIYHERGPQPRGDIWGFGKRNGITFICRDITQPALHNFRCDWCFHLAALADIVPSVRNPIPYHRVNVEGTVNVLDHAVRLGVKRFIYASSTSIYGIPKEYPTPETAPADPQYPYALTKWLAEESVMHFGKVYKLPVLSLRITTAYGPKMRSTGYGSAFKVFLAQKANNVPYTIVGDGSQSRDFVWVDDVVNAFIKAAESDVEGEVFNVGVGKPRKINDLLKLLGDENGVVYLPKRPGEPDVTWADINKARVMLGWEPQFSLEEGVKIMLARLDEWKKERVWTKETIEEATREWFRCLN